jgi:hypothetical protein
MTPPIDTDGLSQPTAPTPGQATKNDDWEEPHEYAELKNGKAYKP